MKRFYFGKIPIWGLNRLKRFALLAQLVEQRAFNPWVLGSMVSWIAQWYFSKDSEHRPVKQEDIGSIPTQVYTCFLYMYFQVKWFGGI